MAGSQVLLLQILPDKPLVWMWRRIHRYNAGLLLNEKCHNIIYIAGGQHDQFAVLI
jgi:hypothetical protein